MANVASISISSNRRNQSGVSNQPIEIISGGVIGVQAAAKAKAAKVAQGENRGSDKLNRKAVAAARENGMCKGEIMAEGVGHGVRAAAIANLWHQAKKRQLKASVIIIEA